MYRVEDLKIWRKSMDLTGLVYKLADKLLSDEKFGLSNQIKKSAISIPSKIAEGAGRNSDKEFLHFSSVSNRSAYELQTQLILLVELELILKEKISRKIISILIT